MSDNTQVTCPVCERLVFVSAASPTEIAPHRNHRTHRQCKGSHTKIKEVSKSAS
jgi:hypothetical protein